MSDEITDALAASLLKREASERSLRYSAFGMAFGGDRKKPNSAPKPNTRFLKNLVKEADSHNAALLAKEAEEARLRLEKLRRENNGGRKGGRDRSRERYRRSSRSRSPERSTRRKDRSRSRSKERQKRDRDGDDRKDGKRPRVEIGDIDRLLQASRRERRDGEKGKDKEKDKERSNRDRERSHSRERGSRRDRRDKERRRSKSRDRTRRSHRSKRSRTASPSRSRSRSSSPDRRRHKSHKRHKSRSRSPSSSRSPRKRRRSASPKAPRSNPAQDEKMSRLSPPQDDEDPLAEYLSKKSANRSPEIGPSLPYKTKNGPRPRGRGLPGSSAMDARFDPSYDPTMDVTPTNPQDEDDWEAALEALRDRQKWKQQGKERLKAAGFADDFIEAWETNKTKDESKIKWSKEKGGRDWDRGKVIDDKTGEVTLKASWAT
ncbi:hypothetical protein TWF481_008173 [Arthrobotrys musiformis]|uniref:Pre-mRNA-splicing factor 38B n=1 Tax=Arthrobotrys musiformis TaxID=47236 RepID=A0AAV9W6H6_9PEZI